MTTEALPHRQANRPRLTDVVADTSAQPAFTVEGEFRVRVKDVLRVSDELKAAIPTQPEGGVNKRVRGQFQRTEVAVLSAEISGDWIEEDEVDEPGARLLIRRLSISASHLLNTAIYVPVTGLAEWPLVISRQGELVLRHHRQTIAVADTADDGRRVAADQC